MAAPTIVWEAAEHYGSSMSILPVLCQITSSSLICLLNASVLELTCELKMLMDQVCVVFSSCPQHS